MPAVPDFSKPYRVDNGRKFRLKDFDPADTSEVKSKKHAEMELPCGDRVTRYEPASDLPIAWERQEPQP